MKAFVVATAVLAAAVAVFVTLTVPPRRIPLGAAGDGSIPGVVHVHTDRSDGSSGPDEIAAAAARAGLKFVVFTDHGDGTRTPDPPTYRAGVLCLDGVEISTNGGHYVAFDMPASPYPLAGDARDVVEDVRRLGGFGVAAHPDSPKPQLRWIEWTAPIDGVELLNPDTSWRVLAQQPGRRGRFELLTALIDYPFRPSETIASLIQPSGAVYSWLALTQRRRVVAMAGLDAHARVNLRGDPVEGRARYALPIPGYEAAFRSMALHVALDRPLSGSAAADAAVLMRAIRGGHFYTSVDGTAGPPAFEFSATNDLGTVHEGDAIGVGGPVSLRIVSNAPPQFTTIVHEGARVVTSVRDPQELVVHAPAAPGVYWVEIVSNARTPPLTWLRSNPIYVRGPEPLTQAPTRPPVSASQPVPLDSDRWSTEHDPTSGVTLDRTGTGDQAGLRFGFTLGAGTPIGKVTALVAAEPQGLAADKRLAFTIRADRPMRVSVQLRSGGARPERWQRSVYVGRFDQERTVYFDDLTPVGDTETWSPPLDRIQSLMFVVDAVNTKPGTSGTVWIRKVALER